MSTSDYVQWFEDLRSTDVALVGGKNSSLGEMTSQLRKYDIPIPPGFATTSKGYWETIDATGTKFVMKSELKLLKEGKKSLAEVGRTIRKAVSSSPLYPELEGAILDYYYELCDRCGEEDLSVAVRSSATAEDLPEASFAGQQETFLNIRYV
jgi:pyruvate,water dikinase